MFDLPPELQRVEKNKIEKKGWEQTHFNSALSGELPQSLVPRVLGKTPQVNEDHNPLHF